jgi:hypothetical protein
MGGGVSRKFSKIRDVHGTARYGAKIQTVVVFDQKFLPGRNICPTDFCIDYHQRLANPLFEKSTNRPLISDIGKIVK